MAGYQHFEPPPSYVDVMTRQQTQEMDHRTADGSTPLLGYQHHQQEWIPAISANIGGRGSGAITSNYGGRGITSNHGGRGSGAIMSNHGGRGGGAITSNFGAGNRAAGTTGNLGTGTGNHGVGTCPTTMAQNVRPQRREFFNMTKFVMLWSGSGRCHCFLCFLINFAFLASGGALLFFTLENAIGAQVWNYTMITTVLCSLSGVTSILLCLSWSWTIFATQCSRPTRNLCRDFCRRSTLDDRRNYTSISCCFWFTAIVFICCATALLIDFLNKSTMAGWSYACEEDIEFVFCLEFWTLLSMWSLVCVFLCCNILCYCCCIRQAAGQICNSC